MHPNQYTQLRTASGGAAMGEPAHLHGPKLSVREAAAFLGLSKSTMDKLRCTGGGPVYLRLGRRVLYNHADLEAWAQQGRRSNTSQAA